MSLRINIIWFTGAVLFLVGIKGLVSNAPDADLNTFLNVPVSVAALMMGTTLVVFVRSFRGTN